MKNAGEFFESQKFTQPWIWLIAGIPGIAILGLFALGIYRQVILGQQFGKYPMSDSGLILVSVMVTLVLVVLAMLFGFAKLILAIDDHGISYRFFPFHLKVRRILWEEVEQYELISYSPIRDYGGWGMRGNSKRRVYNVSGDKGLLIRLKAGKEILIGTGKAAELRAFLAGLTKK